VVLTGKATMFWQKNNLLLLAVSRMFSVTESDKFDNDSSSSSIGTTTFSWASACSTVVEHSQQEGFIECRCQRHV
jgi:hypothetical protein